MPDEIFEIQQQQKSRFVSLPIFFLTLQPSREVKKINKNILLKSFYYEIGAEKAKQEKELQET
jgi:hypothetical protein